MATMATHPVQSVRPAEDVVAPGAEDAAGAEDAGDAEGVQDAPRSVMPRDTYEWTVDDLEQLPDDGLQYELLDGILLVSPAPIVPHQRAAREIFLLLHDACPPEMEVFFAPVDWQPDRRTSLQPDVLVVRKDLIGYKNLTDRLELAVEVLSPSTRRKDLVLKFSKYADVGVPSYWVVDPQEPSVTVWDLQDGGYAQVGYAQGSDPLTIRLPYEITVIPAALV
jgi:Uma2 family endonuclease